MSNKSEYTIKERTIGVKGANWLVFYQGKLAASFFTKAQALSYVKYSEDANGQLAREDREKLNNAMTLLACDDLEEEIAERMKKDKKFLRLVLRASCNLVHAQHLFSTKEKF